MATEIREFAHLEIPLEVIQKATNNFSDENIIGKGGFGYVYKGQITHRGELTNIVARRSNRRRGQADVEFWTEISVLSGNHHKYYNTVELIGYVDEKEEKIIINRDNFAKGSLVKYLSDPTFTCSQRLYVSIDLARAIGYIHHSLDQSYYIIHRNINSYTVLLDDDWGAWLSGFEYSLKHPKERRNQIFLCDEVIGTHGYMDPADLKNGGVNHKSDIYSFGVVLFELMCGRKAKDDQDNNKLLVSLAKFHYENGTMHEIIHPDLLKQMSQRSLKCFSKAAYSCLQEDRARRPDVEKVLRKLQKALSLKSTYYSQMTYGKNEEYEEKVKDMNNGKDAEDEIESDQNDEEDDNETYGGGPYFLKSKSQKTNIISDCTPSRGSEGQLLSTLDDALKHNLCYIVFGADRSLHRGRLCVNIAA
uniref:probable receptor-like protein kinase At2g23200 n=1 Tax=Erigeron canadensis TaxID=72917 RepID=UPI001CB8D1CD|nr:probable receptor-like protein kinase At2g23200 [Erigeron canadensis]